jgi:hypothetical protein
MPYDASLDSQIFTKSWETEDQKITVSVYSYNNGPKKMQIVREVKDNQGNFRFSKLGRLSKDEIDALLPFIQEARGHM